MEEADLLGDRIGIMGHGKLLCCGSSMFLKRLYGAGYNLVLETANHCDGSAIKAVVEEHVADCVVQSNVGKEQSYQLPLGATRSFAGLFEALDSAKGLGVVAWGLSITTMESVFLKVIDTGAGAKAEPPSAATPSTAPSTESTEAESEGIGLSVARDETLLRRQNGCARCCSHTYALYVKRLHYARRDKSSILCSTVIPIVLLVMGLLILKNSLTIRTPRPLALDFESSFGSSWQPKVPVHTIGSEWPLGQAIHMVAGASPDLELASRPSEHELHGINYTRGCPSQFNVGSDDDDWPQRCTPFADFTDADAPMLNAVLLERIISPVSNISAVSFGHFTGAEPGEGLDLSGSFEYAVNIGGLVATQVNDATFTTDRRTPGFSIRAPQHDEDSASNLFFENASAADTALAGVMHGIRLSHTPETLVVTLDVQPAGQKYKLQLLFCEDGVERGFDVMVDGRVILREFSPQKEIGGGDAGSVAAFVSYEFVSDNSTLTIELGNLDPQVAQLAEPTLAMLQDLLVMAGEAETVSADTVVFGAMVARNTSADVSVLINTTATHAVPIFLNALSNGFAKQLAKDHGGGQPAITISVASVPLPVTDGISTMLDQFSNVIAVLFIVIAFSFVPGSIVSFVVKEREAAHNCKHQQLISGVSIAGYWVSSFLWDSTLYCCLTLGPTMVVMILFSFPAFTGTLCEDWNATATDGNGANPLEPDYFNTAVGNATCAEVVAAHSPDQGLLEHFGTCRPTNGTDAMAAAGCAEVPIIGFNHGWNAALCRARALAPDEWLRCMADPACSAEIVEATRVPDALDDPLPPFPPEQGIGGQQPSIALLVLAMALQLAENGTESRCTYVPAIFSRPQCELFNTFVAEKNSAMPLTDCDATLRDVCPVTTDSVRSAEGPPVLSIDCYVFVVCIIWVVCSARSPVPLRLACFSGATEFQSSPARTSSASFSKTLRPHRFIPFSSPSSLG